MGFSAHGKMITFVSVNSYYQTNSSGSILASFVDMDFKRTFDQYPVGAEAIVRLEKDFSNSDSVELLQLRTAKLSLSEPFLTVTVGRMDLGHDLSPTEYFGNYLTMGLHRLDGIDVTIPIKFSLALQTLQALKTPPTAFSFFYFPSLLSNTTASYDETQSLFIEQFRVMSSLEKIPFSLQLNVSQSPSRYLLDSTLNRGWAYSVGFSVTPASLMSIYGEYGTQNASQSGTSALTVGLKGEDLFALGPVLFESADIEVQRPMSTSLDNPFTGGNALNPSLASLHQETFFARLQARIEAIFMNFYVTDYVGDYTFARINSLNTALPPGVILGGGNEVL